MNIRFKHSRKYAAMLLCGGLLASGTGIASAELLAFNSFEDAGGELGFVTSLVAPNPIPGSGVWWIYPSATTPAPDQTDSPIFFTDSYNDYFTVNYPGTIDLVSSANPSTTGRDGGAEFTAEDVSKDGISSGTASLTFDPVNINGYTDVQVVLSLAASEGTAFESSDFIRIEAKEPGGGTTRLGYFTGDGDGDLSQDTDGDSTADGPKLSTTYQDITFDVPAGLFEFSLEIDVSVDDSEEFFVDNVRINGNSGGVVRDPILVVDTTPLDFGRVDPGSTKDATVTISNNSAASQNLVINNTSAFSGTDASYFSIVDSLPINIAPGASQDITVRLTAPALGGDIYDDATLTIVSNDNVTATADIPLSGRVPSTTVATVTVNGTQNPPTSFGTIDQAVDYLDVNAVGQPWKINVTTDGPAVEPTAIELKTNAFGGVTIDGDADNNGTPYTIITDAAAPGSQANYATGSTYAAMVIEADSATYNISDLIFVPAYVGDGATLDDTIGGSSGVRVLTIDDYENGPLTQRTINLENITIAGSTAGNTPSMDPDNNLFATTTHYSRGINIFSSATEEVSPTFAELTMNNVKIFNTALDGFSHGGDYMDVTVGPGCIFAWSGETPFLVSGNSSGRFTMAGTSSERIFITGSGQSDADEEGLAVIPNSDFDWDLMSYVDIIGNGAEIDFGPGQGPETVEYCRFAFNDVNNDDADGSDTGVRFGYTLSPDVSATTTRTFRNVTFHDGMNPAGTQYGMNFISTGIDGMTFNLIDCIISGAGDTGINMRAGNESTLNLTNCAIVTAGPDALATDFEGTFDGSTGNFTLNQSAVINSDPQYVNTTYIYGNSDDFLLPGSASYSTSSSLGGVLYGGAVPPGTNVSDWTLY